MSCNCSGWGYSVARVLVVLHSFRHLAWSIKEFSIRNRSFQMLPFTILVFLFSRRRDNPIATLSLHTPSQQIINSLWIIDDDLCLRIPPLVHLIFDRSNWIKNNKQFYLFIYISSSSYYYFQFSYMYILLTFFFSLKHIWNCISHT